MLSSSLRFVPWRNKDEWMSVYKNAFSDDPVLKRTACDVMELWLCLRNDAPTAIECTLSLLQVLLKDNPETVDRNDVGLMFSSTILRVVNLIAESSRKSSGESLYQLADAAQLPDWVINLRHDIAHGGSLPSTDTLRLAATFALQWIKTYYWDVECEAYKDIIIDESASKVFSRNISGLLSAYIDETKLLDEKLSTSDLDDLSLKAALSAVAPWIYASKKVGFPRSGYNPVDSIVGHLTSYLSSPNFRSQTFPIFVSQLCSYTQEQSGVIAETWSPLVNYMNKRLMLGTFLLFLCQETVSAARDVWIRSISYAISLKLKVDQERRRILSSIPFKDGPEAKAAEQIILPKKLKLSPECTETEITDKLFTRIESQHKEFNGVIRLNDSVDYVMEECAVSSAIHALAAQPYPDIYPLLDILFPLVEPKMAEKIERQVKALIGLYLGERGMRPNNKMYTLDDLLRTNSASLPPPKQPRDDSVPAADKPKIFYRCSAPVMCCLDVSDVIDIRSHGDVEPCKYYFPLS